MQCLSTSASGQVQVGIDAGFDLILSLGGDKFGLAIKPLAQFRVLRCDSYRAGVQMARAHHDAPAHD